MDYQQGSDDDENSLWSLDKIHKKVFNTACNLNEHFTP